MSEENKISEFTTYAIGFNHSSEELTAEFNLFNAVKAFMETDRLPDGTFVKLIRANFALAQEEIKSKSKIIMPETGLVS